MFKINRATNEVASRAVDSRISWPWKDMNVGDSVTVDGDLAVKAQVSAHVYGRSRSIKFKTKMTNGSLYVERVE